ncbi:hypothetical protein FO519_010952, partial [Halicephalobus sp. NKZ332]
MVLLFSLIYVAVLLADKFEKPILYLPFLIIGGIGLILGIVEIVVLIVLLFVSPKVLYEGFHQENDGSNTMSSTTSPQIDEGTFKIIMIIALVILIICELIGLYFWNIVR